MMMIRLTTIASTGRRRNRSVNRMSVVLWMGVQLGARLQRVVDQNRRVVAQLEGARADQLVARLHAVEHGYDIAARFAQAHELLARILDHLAVLRGLGAG